MAKLSTIETLSPEVLTLGAQILSGDLRAVLGAVGHAVGETVHETIVRGYDVDPDASVALDGEIYLEGHHYIPTWAEDIEVEIETEGDGTVTEVTVDIDLGSGTISLVGALGVLSDTIAVSTTGTDVQLWTASGTVTGGTGDARLRQVAIRAVPLTALPDPA